jgi:UDP-sugar diphosphatase
MLKKVEIKAIVENSAPRFVVPQLVEATVGGRLRYWEMIKGHDSVHISVFNRTTNEFLFVKQVRIPVLVNESTPKTFRITDSIEVTIPAENVEATGEIIEACAGLIDKDASIQQIAKEEIEEELGYDIPAENVYFIKQIHSSVGTAGNKAFLFYAEVTEDNRVSDGGGLEEEDIEVVRVNRDDISSFIMNADTDAVTMFLTTYHDLIV